MIFKNYLKWFEVDQSNVNFFIEHFIILYRVLGVRGTFELFRRVKYRGDMRNSSLNDQRSGPIALPITPIDELIFLGIMENKDDIMSLSRQLLK